MRLALARAGLWFFGAIIVTNAAGSSTFKNSSRQEWVTALVIIGIIVGATAFFYTLTQYHKVERELEVQERRLKIKQAQGSTTAGDTGNSIS